MQTRRSSFALVFLLGLSMFCGTPNLRAETKRKPGDPYALIRGTVFLESGLSQAGAKVGLSTKAQPKKKVEEQISNSSGEFAFRVPVGPGEYILTVTLKGFETVSQEVAIAGQEQVNQNLSLVPASKK